MNRRCGWAVREVDDYFGMRDVVVLTKGLFHYWMPRNIFDDMDDAAFKTFMDDNYQHALAERAVFDGTV